MNLRCSSVSSRKQWFRWPSFVDRWSSNDFQRCGVSVAWLMKGTPGPKGDARDKEKHRKRKKEQKREEKGRGRRGGKKKEERIKRRVPVDLPIDNGFHLYNSTPRATLNPFCLFSLMLFYHPFAAVFHVSPITCHPRTYALFLRPKILSALLPPQKEPLLMSFALTFLLLTRMCYRLCTPTLCHLCYQFVNVFGGKLNANGCSIRVPFVFFPLCSVKGFNSVNCILRLEAFNW